MAKITHVGKWIKREVRRDNGNMTVAFALWLPFIMAFFCLIADTALVFYGQARALQVAQDANRAFSVGKLQTSADTERWVKLALSSISPNATARTQTQDSIVTTSVTMPARDLIAVGFFPSITSLQVTAIAQMAMEF